VSETAWNLLGIALPMLHFQTDLIFPYMSTPSWRLAKLFVYGDNFLHEPGGQQYSC